MADKNKKNKDERSGESRDGGVIAPATVVGSAKASPSVSKAAVVVPSAGINVPPVTRGANVPIEGVASASGNGARVVVPDSGLRVVLPDVASQANSSVDSQINNLGVPYESETFKPLDASQPSVKPFSIADAVFGPEQSADASVSAADVRDQRFQDWLNARRQAVEQQRTDDVRMARLNAIGNVLTTMVQPLGWAIGGQGKATGGVQPIDNRQYLQAFERAMKANDDLRNIGTLEGEYQFKLADDAYRREQAMADYEQKAQIELQKQKQIFDMRSQLSKQQMEERIKVAEATAKAKLRFSTKSGQKVTESVRDNLLKRANAAYAQILADYYKKKNVGIENLKEPPSYDEFLKQFASQNGYTVAESQSEQQSADKPSGKKANPMGSAASTSASGKKKNPMS